jgi:hypothetical protein
MYTEQESPWKIWQLDWEALPPARERERKIRDMTTFFQLPAAKWQRSTMIVHNVQHQLTRAASVIALGNMQAAEFYLLLAHKN